MAHRRNLIFCENPPRAGQLMSREVLAVVYKNIADPDDVVRVHGFGDADIKVRMKRGGRTLEIDGLEELTDVQMIAEPSGDVTLHHKNGSSLWRDFK